jgi:hypothetical protein
MGAAVAGPVAWGGICAFGLFGVKTCLLLVILPAEYPSTTG